MEEGAHVMDPAGVAFEACLCLGAVLRRCPEVPADCPSSQGSEAALLDRSEGAFHVSRLLDSSLSEVRDLGARVAHRTGVRGNPVVGHAVWAELLLAADEADRDR